MNTYNHLYLHRQHICFVQQQLGRASAPAAAAIETIASETAAAIGAAAAVKPIIQRWEQNV